MKITFNRDNILRKVKANSEIALKKIAEGVKNDMVQGLGVDKVSQPGDIFPGRDTGDLQASVKIKDETGEENPKIFIYTDSDYARALEFGARIETGHGEIYIAPRPGWRHTFLQWKPKIIKMLTSAIKKGFN